MRLLNRSQIAYSDIGRNQVDLTEAEEIALVNEYKDERDKLHRYILDRGRCGKHFFKRYEETKAAGRSVAKLSADYNPRKAGLNKIIEQKFGYELDRGRRRRMTTLPKPLKFVVFDLNLSDELYAEMETHLQPTAKLRAIKDRISEIENTLFCSMLMAGSTIAKAYASNLLGVDEADATQQVSIFLLESIRKYDPSYRTPKGKRVKLCTFAYNRSENLLKEWILTNSRLVRVPRSKMERILIVVKAYDILELHDINLFTLTEESNKILDGRDKLSGDTMFTVDEVDALIKILTSSYIHLDQPYRMDKGSNTTTIGDMLSKDQPSPIDIIEEQDNREQLFEIMQDNLEDIEFQVIMLRWFHDPASKVPKALTEVGPLLASVYGGTAYSRESVRQIEQAAIAKLKEVREVHKLWSH